LAIYKTVQIIFPLNHQTITITLDVVKWRGGGFYLERGWFGVAVTAFVTSTELSYVEPG